MAYETKVILSSLATHCLYVDKSKQVYEIIRSIAQTEGLKLASYDEAKASLEADSEKAD